MDVKEPVTFDEQLKKLKERGCIIPDEGFATLALQRINYYRLSAYFLPYQNAEGKYRDGTSFETVYRIYEFDRKLRNLIFSVIEEIELMLRTQLAYYHSHKYGSLGYLEPENFNKRHKHDRFLEHIKSAIAHNNKQLFVKHHIEKYDSTFPLWVIVELFTVGELSFFFSDMLRVDKKSLAKQLFNVSDDRVSSWLLCLTNLRNYCAHYARLYYNRFSAVPATPQGCSYVLGDRVFDYILVLKFLYPDSAKWHNQILVSLCALLEEYHDAIELKCIGFPEEWEAFLE